MLRGIDVSEHQGKINWKSVKDSGIQFAMLRAGYGRNNIDKQFVNNANGCTNVGIPFGLYWFSYAYTVEMAKQEARYCIAQAKEYNISYPICYDLEYDTVRYAKKCGVTITKDLASQMVIAFCTEIEKAGYYAMNYSNRDYMRNMFDSSTNKYDLWYAWYNAQLDRNADSIGIWQYSSNGRVNGISGNVDMNRTEKDYPTIIKAAGLNDFDGAAPVIKDNWDDSVKGKIGVITGNGVNVRLDPGKDTTVLGSVNKGDKVTLFRLEGEWYHCYSLYKGYNRCYIHKDYVKIISKPVQNKQETWQLNINGDIIRELQNELNIQYNAGIKVDGWAGDITIDHLPVVRQGAKGNITRIIQKILLLKGYKLPKYGEDGTFGEEMKTAVLQVQKDNGLSTDSVIGRNTWKALLRK